MSWEHRVYLAKKKISGRALTETYRKMRARFGAPDQRDYDGDGYEFAQFRIRVGVDAKAGTYLYVHGEDVGLAAEDAGACMDAWAELLGGAISEEQWNERRGDREKELLAARKLPKLGPAESYLYVAFDDDGAECGRKAVSIEMAQHVTLQILDAAWLRKNGVRRVERITFDVGGAASDNITYDVDRKGELRRVWDD